MELHERQQFDFLLHTAVERYAERLEQRNEGAGNALARLRQNRDGETIRLSQFTDAIFEDFLLNNSEGACFVLRALASRPCPVFQPGANIGATLIALAKQAFAALLYSKTEECLEQHASFQAAN